MLSSPLAQKVKRKVLGRRGRVAVSVRALDRLRVARRVEIGGRAGRHAMRVL